MYYTGNLIPLSQSSLDFQKNNLEKSLLKVKSGLYLNTDITKLIEDLHYLSTVTTATNENGICSPYLLEKNVCKNIGSHFIKYVGWFVFLLR